MKNRTKLMLSAVLTVMILATVFTFVLASTGVTVSFYDGGKLISDVSVAEGAVPTAPQVDEIVVTDGVGYRFIGWATAEGGEATELTAVTEATSFYAVREAVEYKVEGADGTVTWYKPGETTLSTLMVNAAAGDYITACSDTAVTGTGAVHCTKSFTLDLNGNTLSTDYYFVPNKSTHVKICNGTVSVTKQPLAQTWRDRNGAAVIELCDLTVKKTDATVATYFLDVQIGSAILDNVTVADGEWNVPTSSTYFIRAGYKTKTEVQDVNITVKNSNFVLPEISFISAGGASSETNGYNLHVDIIGSTVKTDKYIVNFAPPSATAAKCKLDVKLSEKSVIDAGGFSAEIAFNFGSGVLDENVSVWADYGVEFSRYPKLSVGTLKLGDGDDMLEVVTDNGYGVVTDLWVTDYTPVTDYAYSFCVVGDTQMAVEYDPNNFHYLYDWILANKDAKNMKFVFGLGDVTNHSKDKEWNLALQQISRLNGVIDYSLVRGNHDTSETYNATFNNSEYKSQFMGFYSEDQIENSYITFVAGKHEYLNITLDYHPTNEVVAWAASVIESHPDHRVIISTHSYLAADGTLDTRNSGTGTNSGAQLWSKLVSQYENVFMVLSGHVSSTDVKCLQSKGVNGNTVTQIMANGQYLDYRNGAMGMVAMLYFSEDGNTVAVEYYSTVHGKYLGERSQFTLTVGESGVPVPPSEDTLYAVTNPDGVTTFFDNTTKFSTLIQSADVADGAYITVYGDIDVDASFKINKNLTIDLNGNTISTNGSKLQGGNKTVNLVNGTAKITNNVLVYIETGYPSSVFNLKNIQVINEKTGDRYWNLADMRSGTLNLNNVTVTAEGWNGATSSLISGGYRTNDVSRPINVNFKNCDINLGTSSDLIGFTAQKDETKGWMGNVSIVDSVINVGGCFIEAIPTDNSAPNCGVNVTVSGKSTVSAGELFALSANIPTANISASFGMGVKLSDVPAIDGVDISFNGGVLAVDPAAGLYTVTTESECACKLVDAEGKDYVYVSSTSFTNELVQMAQDAGCSIVFLRDMTMPAGTKDANYTIKTATLHVDLNGKQLTMPNYSRFTTDANTVLSFANGTVQTGYNVFYSYSGNSKVTSFTATNVKFIATSSNQVFDHRIGIMTLTDCEFEFKTAPTSASFVIALGYVKNTSNSAKLVLVRTDIHCTGTARSVFKLYGGRPVTIEATDCDFSVGENAFIVNAEKSSNYTGEGRPVDSVTFTGCTFTKNGEALVNAAYAEISITAINTVAPTCAAEGYKATVNMITGEVAKSEIVSALGHVYDNDTDTDCNVCGDIREIIVTEGPLNKYISWSYADGVLTITGKGKIKNFNAGTTPWNSFADLITEVVISEGITYVGSSAFYNCTNLAKVTLPETLTAIGNYTFYMCSALTEITIPASVTEIGIYAFRSTGITTAEFGITYGWTAGENAFASADIASSAAIMLRKTAKAVWTRDVNAEPDEVDPNYVTGGICKNGTTKWAITLLENGKYKLTISGNGKMPDFGTGATPWFNYKDQIVEIEVAEGVTAIGRAAFYMLRYVKTVTLPETLTVIGDYAFRNCNSLSTIVIPASVTGIGDEAFAKTKVALQ